MLALSGAHSLVGVGGLDIKYVKRLECFIFILTVKDREMGRSGREASYIDGQEKSKVGLEERL